MNKLLLPFAIVSFLLNLALLGYFSLAILLPAQDTVYGSSPTTATRVQAGMINAQIQANRLDKPYYSSRDLCVVAQTRAIELQSDPKGINHDGFSTVWEDYRLEDYNYIAEILYKAPEKSLEGADTAQMALDAWKASPTHNAVLEDANHDGLCVHCEGLICVAIFGDNINY